MMHGGTEGRGGHGIAMGVERRLIFLAINGVEVGKPYDVFSIGAKRTPQFMLDMDIHNLVIHDIKDLPRNTGWGKVPTPVF